MNSGLVYKQRNDRNVSDPEFNKQINIISQAVKVHPITGDLKRGPSELPLDYYEERLLGNLPTEGRILIEEYYKALYLNDQDMEKYNFKYWIDYFKVSNITLRNAFNYVFFPIPDENNPTEVGKILTFKDYEFDNRRKLISEMSKGEYMDYLSKTEERPELEELKRLEYINIQKTAKQPRISERTIPHLDQEIDDNLDNALINSDIIKQIDYKISEIVTNDFESKGLQLDADIKLKLEEIKSKRIKIEAENIKKLYQNPELIPTFKDPDDNSEKYNKLTDRGKIHLVTHEDANNKESNQKIQPLSNIISNSK